MKVEGKCRVGKGRKGKKTAVGFKSSKRFKFAGVGVGMIV